jgi:hypothetical protein
MLCNFEAKLLLVGGDIIMGFRRYLTSKEVFGFPRGSILETFMN